MFRPECEDETVFSVTIEQSWLTSLVLMTMGGWTLYGALLLVSFFRPGRVAADQTIVS
jgi:hypothetical protein